jgi:hypothetical protein
MGLAGGAYGPIASFARSNRICVGVPEDDGQQFGHSDDAPLERAMPAMGA